MDGKKHVEKARGNIMKNKSSKKHVGKYYERKISQIPSLFIKSSKNHVENIVKK